MNRCTWSLPESVGPIGTLVVNVRVNGVVTVAPLGGEVIVSVGLLLPHEDEPEPLPFEPHAVASSAAAPIVIASVWTRIDCSLEVVHVLLSCYGGKAGAVHPGGMRL